MVVIIDEVVLRLKSKFGKHIYSFNVIRSSGVLLYTGCYTR